MRATGSVGRVRSLVAPGLRLTYSDEHARPATRTLLEGRPDGRGVHQERRPDRSTVKRQDPSAIHIGVRWVERSERDWYVERVPAAIAGWLLQQLDWGSDQWGRSA